MADENIGRFVREMVAEKRKEFGREVPAFFAASCFWQIMGYAEADTHAEKVKNNDTV